MASSLGSSGSAAAADSLWWDYDVSQSVVGLSIFAVNTIFWAPIRELVLFISSETDDDVGSSAFAAVPATDMQLLYAQLASMYGWLSVLLPLLVVFLVRKALPHSKWGERKLIDALVVGFLVLSLAFPAFWIVARLHSEPHFAKLAARDPEVTAAFNALYCRARSAELCAFESPSRSHLAKLVQVFNGANESASSREEAAMTSVFLACQHSLVANRGGLSPLQAAFVKSSNTSDAVDEWCGGFVVSTATNAGTHSPATTSTPASINDAKFDASVTAWKALFLADMGILGIASFCAILFCLHWLRMPETHKRAVADGISLRSREDEERHRTKLAAAAKAGGNGSQKWD